MRFTRNPTTAADIVAVAAMLVTMLAIVWARIALYGTADIEDALAGESSPAAATACTGHTEALVRNRWIVGFSQ